MKYQPTKERMKLSNDNIQTPPDLAKAIVDYYTNTCTILALPVLEPFAGEGNIVKELEAILPFNEETKRRIIKINTVENDFYKDYSVVKTIITNPPWSQFKQALKHSFLRAETIIFLIPLNKVFGLKSTFKLLAEYKWKIRHVKLWDTPKEKPWPQSGFQLSTVTFEYIYITMLMIFALIIEHL